MGIEITESAKEHGFGMADAIHALQTPIVTVDGYGQGRGGHRPPKGWIGPAVGGLTIEVLADEDRRGNWYIFHIMEARTSTINAMLNHTEDTK